MSSNLLPIFQSCSLCVKEKKDQTIVCCVIPDAAMLDGIVILSIYPSAVCMDMVAEKKNFRVVA